MASPNPIGFGGSIGGFGLGGPHVEHVVLVRPLQKLLAFRRRSIDDVVNCPLVKNEIRAYWKMHRQIHRLVEIGDLERQWNAVRL